jgi:hypothetical protein
VELVGAVGRDEARINDISFRQPVCFTCQRGVVMEVDIDRVRHVSREGRVTRVTSWTEISR